MATNGRQRPAYVRAVCAAPRALVVTCNAPEDPHGLRCSRGNWPAAVRRTPSDHCPFGTAPVAWHFKQGAAVLVKSWRAMVSSAAVRVSTFGGMYGRAWCEMASKNSTRERISWSGKEDVGVGT